MEDKVIGFGKGIHREPSLGSVGELSDCVNIYGDGGEMKLLPRPVEVAGLGRYDEALCIHDNHGVYKHVIVKYSKETVNEQLVDCNCIGWRNFGTSSSEYGELVKIASLGSGETINDVTTIGNVLVVASSVKMYYYLWVDGEYRDYSLDSIEDLDIRFSLKGEYVQGTTNTIKVVDLNSNNVGGNDYDSLVASIHRVYKQLDYFELTLETEDAKLVKDVTYNLNIKTDDGEYCGCVCIYGTTDNTATYSDFYGWTKGDTKNTKGFVELAYAQGLNPKKKENDASFVSNDDYVKLFAYYLGSPNESGATITIRKRNGDSVGFRFTVDKTDSANVDSLMGDILKHVATNSTNKNKFMYPFFVRYAIEMVDGTMIHPSSPILMIPNSGAVPNCFFVNDIDIDQNNSAITIARISSVCCDLEYQILNNSVIQQLQNRKQVIRGVLIGVSEPIYTVDFTSSSDKINKYLYLKERNAANSDNGVSCAKITNMTAYSNKYSEIKKNNIDSATITTGIKYDITLPEVEEYETKIENASRFYVVKRIEIDDLDTTKTTLKMEEGALKSLVSKKTIDDNTTSLKAYNAETLYPYNNRLTLGNLKETIFKGYNPELMNGFIDGTGEDMVYAVTTVERNNKKLLCGRGTVPLNGSKVKWFYYPDPKAKTVTIQYGADASNFITLELKEHPSLNGAYYYGGLEAEEIEQDSDASAARVRARIPTNNSDFAMDKKSPFGLDRFMAQDEVDGGGGSGNDGIVVIPDGVVADTIPDIEIDEDTGSIVIDDSIKTSWNDISPQITTKNKIVSSVLNNPFAIDGSSTSLVGMGEVQKLISNTRALSQGQFGSHPVLAFCSDGIWALSVDDEGGFSAVQPISRDVCNNVGAITQTDSAVVFTSARGLMLIDGSNVKKLCEVMDNKEMFDLDMLNSYYGYGVVNDRELLFTEMLKTCKILYDYENGLLWIYPYLSSIEDSEGNVIKRRAYVVSIKSEEVYTFVDAGYETGQVGVSNVLNGPEAVVVDYPYSYAQFYERYMVGVGEDRAVTESRSLYAFKRDVSDDNVIKNAYLLTRPIPFDEAYVMKMLYDMKVEGMRTSDGSSFKVVVFVSNDRVNWKRLSSMKARSYKWYRFAVLCRMNDYDRLTGLICRIDRRRENKIR